MNRDWTPPPSPLPTPCLPLFMLLSYASVQKKGNETLPIDFLTRKDNEIHLGDV